MAKEFNSKFIFYEVGWAAGVNRPTPFFYSPTIHPEVTIIYTFQGNFQLKRPEKVYTFKKNSLGIFWAMVPFTITEVSADNVSAYITIPYEDLSSSPDFNRLLKRLIVPEAFFHPSIPLDFSETFTRWTQEIRTGGQTQKAAIREILSFLCRYDLILSKNSTPEESPLEHSPLFQKLFLYVLKNFANKISEAIISKDLKIHPKSIARCFKKSTGMTLRNYVSNFRLKRAETLLTKSELSVTEIWSQAGFESSSSFYRNFKAIYKKSPEEFREIIKTKK